MGKALGKAKTDDSAPVQGVDKHFNIYILEIEQDVRYELPVFTPSPLHP